MSAVIDLAGQKFGRLTAIERAPNSIHKKARWRCRCECGNEKTIVAGDLRSGRTLACGCLGREQLRAAPQVGSPKHGLCYTPEYRAWGSMIQRCTNSKSRSFKNYGGRGITVCAEWRKSFEAFFAYVGNRPSPDHTLDRFPNQNGNYEPGNVRWATQVEQMNNVRNNVRVVYRGEKMTLPEAIRKAGNIASRTAVGYRIRVGWPIDRAVETPSIRAAT